MRETLLIRPGEESDVAAVAAIYAHHVLTGTASFETEPPTEQEMRRRRADLTGRGYPYLVAAAGAEVLGYAYAGPYRARPAYRHTVENSVYVRPDATRRGIGLGLLECLLTECAARGFRQMIAIVGDSANVASIRLHERAGFRLIGALTAVGFKHGRWLDTVLLQHPLGAGDRDPPSR